MIVVTEIAARKVLTSNGAMLRSLMNERHDLLNTLDSTAGQVVVCPSPRVCVCVWEGRCWEGCHLTNKFTSVYIHATRLSTCAACAPRCSPSYYLPV